MKTLVWLQMATRRHRRACGQTAGKGAGGSRYRSASRVRDECRQAFQMGTARQTAHSRETQCVGDRRVPAMARFGDRRRPATCNRLSRRHGCQVVAGRVVQSLNRAGKIREVDARPHRHGNRPPLINPARTRSDRSSRGHAGVRERFEEAGWSASD